jgi:hypothetical protein
MERGARQLARDQRIKDFEAAALLELPLGERLALDRAAQGVVRPAAGWFFGDDRRVCRRLRDRIDRGKDRAARGPVGDQLILVVVEKGLRDTQRPSSMDQLARPGDRDGRRGQDRPHQGQGQLRRRHRLTGTDVRVHHRAERCVPDQRQHAA